MCASASSPFKEETGHLYNLEATPAEGTTYRFAKEDKKRWPDIFASRHAQQPYYTNSSQLPVGFTDDPFEALQRQESLQTKYTGGTVLHLVYGRAPVQRRRLPRAGQARTHALSAALHHGHAHLLDSPPARLPGRGAPLLQVR